MSDWTDDYQKPELIRISEQIYRKKEEKKEIEIALSETKLQYRYISVREKNMRHKAVLQFLIIAVSLPFSISCLGGLFSMFLGWYLLLFDIWLMIKEVKTLELLILSCNTEWTLAFAERHDIKTFPRERKRIAEQMKKLQLHLDEINQELMELELQKREYIKTQKEREATLRKHGVLFDEAPEKKQTGAFSLKESAVSYTDASELYEFYIRDERYENEYLIKIDGELQYIDKQIVQLKDDFQTAKKKFLLFLVFVVFMIIVQGALDGIALAVTNMICLAGSICGILYLYKTCKQPIIMYLIEQESNLTKEYAFIHSILPIKVRRIDILEEKERCEKEIAEIRKKRAELSFD